MVSGNVTASTDCHGHMRNVSILHIMSFCFFIRTTDVDPDPCSRASRSGALKHITAYEDSYVPSKFALPIVNSRFMNFESIFFLLNMKLLSKMYDDAPNQFFSEITFSCVSSAVNIASVTAYTTAMWKMRIHGKPGTASPLAVSQMHNECRHLELAE